MNEFAGSERRENGEVKSLNFSKEVGGIPITTASTVLQEPSLAEMTADKGWREAARKLGEKQGRDELSPATLRLALF